MKAHQKVQEIKRLQHARRSNAENEDLREELLQQDSSSVAATGDNTRNPSRQHEAKSSQPLGPWKPALNTDRVLPEGPDQRKRMFN